MYIHPPSFHMNSDHHVFLKYWHRLSISSVWSGVFLNAGVCLLPNGSFWEFTCTCTQSEATDDIHIQKFKKRQRDKAQADRHRISESGCLQTNHLPIFLLSISLSPTHLESSLSPLSPIKKTYPPPIDFSYWSWCHYTHTQIWCFWYGHPPFSGTTDAYIWNRLCLFCNHLIPTAKSIFTFSYMWILYSSHTSLYNYLGKTLISHSTFASFTFWWFIKFIHFSHHIL